MADRVSKSAAGLFLTALSLAFLSLSAAPAYAQCETPGPASAAMSNLVSTDIDNINDYINQEWNFLQEDLANTASFEVAQRMDEFNENILAWLNAWWTSHYLPAMQTMTKQLSSMQVEQTLNLGNLMDSQIQAETKLDMEAREAEAHRRFRPGPATCQLDEVGTNSVKAFRMSRALARGFANKDLPRRSNCLCSVSANGKGAESKALWDEYVAKFCDPAKGDQGCTVPGIMAGKSTDVPGLLFGDTQTIDMSTPDNRLLSRAALGTLISPFSSDPVPAGAMLAPAGQEELLKRRSRLARENTVFNAVGQLLAERVGGSGSSTQDIRSAAGVNIGQTSANASYKEIADAMGRARFHNPDYIVRLVNEPEQVVREMGAVKAIQLQQMNDLYKRHEELLFMEAGNYAAKLDERVPDNSGETSPVK